MTDSTGTPGRGDKKTRPGNQLGGLGGGQCPAGAQSTANDPRNTQTTPARQHSKRNATGRRGRLGPPARVASARHRKEACPARELPVALPRTAHSASSTYAGHSCPRPSARLGPCSRVHRGVAERPGSRQRSRRAEPSRVAGGRRRRARRAWNPTPGSEGSKPRRAVWARTDPQTDHEESHTKIVKTYFPNHITTRQKPRPRLAGFQARPSHRPAGLNQNPI